MGVVTKTGDTGTTVRLGGGRVPKNNASVEANGDVDELNSCIGILRGRSLIPEVSSDLENIQKHCFIIGSEFSACQGGDFIDKDRAPIPKIQESHVLFLEERIEKMEKTLNPQKNFILPGGVPVACVAFWVRSVARRAERSAVALNGFCRVNPLDIKYLNRLSDYFFILGRFINYKSNHQETEWNWREGYPHL